MNVGKSQRRGRLNLSLKGKVLETVNAFMYLGEIVNKNGGVGGGVLNKVNEGGEWQAL